MLGAKTDPSITQFYRGVDICEKLFAGSNKFLGISGTKMEFQEIRKNGILGFSRNFRNF
jgi:hypothetical protein